MKFPRFLQILLLFVIIFFASWLLSPMAAWWRAMPLVIFLFSLVAYWGFEESVLWQGIIYALIGELFLGFHSGTFALSFLGALALVFLVQRFVEVQPLSRQVIPRFGHSWFGSVTALALGYMGVGFFYAALERWVYRSPSGWQDGFSFMLQPWALGYTVIGMLMAILFLRVTEKELL